LLQYFDLAAALRPWVHPAAAGDALGNLRQRNQLASLLAIGFAGLLWFAHAGTRVRWLLPAVLLLAIAGAATTSRTGLLHWLALAALAIAWGGPSRRLRVFLCGAGLAAYAAAVLLLPLLLERVTGVTADSLVTRVATDLGCSSRGVLWSNVLQLVAQRPLLGWGWGELDYAHYMNLYAGPRFCDILDNAHNLPLHIAVELGIPAALLFCGAVLVAAWRARPWAEQDARRRLAWSVLAVLAVHSMLEYPLWYAPFQIALGLALGLLLAPRPAPASTRAAPVVATACALLLACASWDYLRVSQVYVAPEDRLAAWRDDTVEHARRSWLFAGQATFAELTLATLTPRTADWIDTEAQAMLHYSPEPRVIEKVIESATMKGRYDDAVLHLARYRAAFPADYELWRKRQKLPIGAAPP
ncbi:MAG: polymerase, partial [Comamonadaceae bacterium]